MVAEAVDAFGEKFTEGRLIELKMHCENTPLGGLKSKTGYFGTVIT